SGRGAGRRPRDRGPERRQPDCGARGEPRRSPHCHGRGRARVDRRRRDHYRGRRVYLRELSSIRGHAASAGRGPGGGRVRRPIVAIDGPAGAGKSTVARLVAERLGYLLLDTGALYRTVALAAQRAGISWGDDAGVTALAEALTRDGAVRLERAADGTLRTLLRGEDVSAQIRTQELGQGASRVSAIPGVRQALLAL